MLQFFNKATKAGLLTISPTGTIAILIGQNLKGSRFTVTLAPLAATGVGVPFWVAPSGCRVISVIERHITVCDAADTLQVTKLPSGSAPGDATEKNTLAAAFTLNSAANTNVTKTAATTADAIFAAGDALCTKFISGDGTNYAGAALTVIMEWA
jgi:hypothetical protein